MIRGTVVVKRYSTCTVAGRQGLNILEVEYQTSTTTDEASALA